MREGYVCAAVLLSVLAAPARGNGDPVFGCGELSNAYGPFDYTNPMQVATKLQIVEDHHFDSGVEQLRGFAGTEAGAASLAGDLDYTLRAFPNHHRALYAMSHYYIEKVLNGAPQMRYSAECYFDRAKRMSPADAITWMLEAMYYQKLDHFREAQEAYRQALRLSPQSPEIHYNFGLLEFERKEYEAARKHARAAYELGYPLPGLRDMLERIGEWSSENDKRGAASNQ